MELNIKKNLDHVAQQKMKEQQNIQRNNHEANKFLARGNLIIRMRGLPYDTTAKQVVDFFNADSPDKHVCLVGGEEGVLFVRRADGRATGDAFVMTATEDDMTKALAHHKELIGTRYIELFRSTPAEVMNRSMDVRHEQTPNPPTPSLPLLPSLPTLPLPPLPPLMAKGNVVAQGARKDCIRLRGLPYECQVQNLLEFLGEHSAHIMFQGVHMVYTTQGVPSGEAFIQMTSEAAAWNCTQQKNKRYLFCGDKSRVVAVLQCSGDDMNFVLSGGALPSPAVRPPLPPAPPHGVGSTVLATYGPGYPPVIGGPRLPPYAPLPPALPHTPYGMVFWSHPSPPVSPAAPPAYYSVAPAAYIPGECYPQCGLPYHPAEIAYAPGEAVATM